DLDAVDKVGNDPERPTTARRLVLDRGRPDSLGSPGLSRGGALPAAWWQWSSHRARALGWTAHGRRDRDADFPPHTGVAAHGCRHRGRGLRTVHRRAGEVPDFRQ